MKGDQKIQIFLSRAPPPVDFPDNSARKIFMAMKLFHFFKIPIKRVLIKFY